MDALTLFGLFAVIAMLVSYALEDRSAWYVLGFAAACALGSIWRERRSDTMTCFEDEVMSA